MPKKNKTETESVLETNKLPPEEDLGNHTTKLDPLDELNNQLSESKNKAKENFEQMLRAKAELENYKKRVSREMIDTRKYALESIMKELLIVIDNLERAIQSSANKNNKKNVKNILDGVNLTLSEMLKILKAHNVTPIKSMKEPFDPKLHQAMSHEENSEYPANTVISELIKGYLIHDRLLRPAMVMVSKKPNQEEA